MYVNRNAIVLLTRYQKYYGIIFLYEYRPIFQRALLFGAVSLSLPFSPAQLSRVPQGALWRAQVPVPTLKLSSELC